MMNWQALLSPKRFGDKTDVSFNQDSRSRFEQDYDRLVFSHPFRKLQDKTQVFPLPEDDFVHTRLTHSLEVSSVGRSLGKAVGEQLLQKSPDLVEVGYSLHDFGAIVAAAALAHDLGNPPFGHSGETAISSFFLDNPKGREFKNRVSAEEWADLIAFEGNAQGFRIMNNLKSGSLRMTFASLGAFTKYPRSSYAKPTPGRKSQKKYGVYRSEMPLFQELANEMQLTPLSQEAWMRHPLTFLVEAADDICYNIIDLEDGCRLGLVTFEETLSLMAPIIGDRLQTDKLRKMPDVNEQLGLLRAMCISELINQCVALFIEKDGDIRTGQFDQALTDAIPATAALDEISRVSIEKIYRSKQVLEREAGGFAVIGHLMEAFCMAAYHKVSAKAEFTPHQKSIIRLLPPVIQIELTQPELSVYDTILLITDFVSSLTDSHAIKLYKTIHGYSLPTSKA